MTPAHVLEWRRSAGAADLILEQLRRYITQAGDADSTPGERQYAKMAATIRASELIAHIDAGGALPVAWSAAE